MDMMVHNLRLALTGWRTPGVIVANYQYVDSRNRGSGFYPVVRFALPGGQTYVVRTTSGTSPPEFQVGQHVTVIYDPRHPESALIDSWRDLLAPLGLIVMGTFFGLAMAWPLLRLLLRRAHKQTRKSNIRPRRSSPARRRR
jgi:hypothetical protein